MRVASSFAIVFFAFGTATGAHAFEYDNGVGYLEAKDPPETSPLVPQFMQSHTGRNLKKFELALRHLGIPLEPTPDFSILPQPGEASKQKFFENSKWIDPKGTLQKHINLTESVDEAISLLSLFRDVFLAGQSPDLNLEYSTTLSHSEFSLDSAPLMSRLLAISDQVSDSVTTLPLKGVKIAIDPGHVGDGAWDNVDGKFVRTPEGTVKEGEINLWTAIQTAKELESLGAKVMITREELKPVSKKDPVNYDVSPQRNQWFYERFEYNWLQKLLSLNEEAFVQAVANHPSVKYELSNDDMIVRRKKYFLLGEELVARADKINHFNPDITIDIHYDANHSSKTQHEDNEVAGYVPGNFLPSETATRYSRVLALHHALTSRKWNESVNLTSEVTASVAKNLGLKVLDSDEFSIGHTIVARKVKPGVYARNLEITRRSVTGLVVYLECLHYDFTGNEHFPVNEFALFSKNDRHGEYHGKKFDYPGRIDQVATGIRDGVLHYFQNLSPNMGVL